MMIIDAIAQPGGMEVVVFCDECDDHKRHQNHHYDDRHHDDDWGKVEVELPLELTN